MRTLRSVMKRISSILGESAAEKFIAKVKTKCKEVDVLYISIANEEHIFKKSIKSYAHVLVSQTFEEVFSKIADRKEFDNNNLYLSYVLSDLKTDMSIREFKAEMRLMIQIVYGSIYYYFLKRKAQPQEQAAKKKESSELNVQKRSVLTEKTIDKINKISMLKSRKKCIEDKLPNITQKEQAEYIEIVKKLSEIKSGANYGSN